MHPTEARATRLGCTFSHEGDGWERAVFVYAPEGFEFASEECGTTVAHFGPDYETWDGWSRVKRALDSIQPAPSDRVSIVRTDGV